MVGLLNYLGIASISLWIFRKLTLLKEFDVNIKLIDDSRIKSFVFEYPSMCTWSTLAYKNI